MKYTPSALVSEFSGAQGSTVASHNRFGPYFRNRTIPTNPNTAAQITYRTILKTASQAWKNLSDAQRAAWSAAAAVLPRIDPLGRVYYQTGHQYFVSTCQAVKLYDSTAAFPTSPATIVTPVDLATFTPTAAETGSAFSVAFGASPVPALTKLVIACTQKLSPGVSYVSPSRLRIVQIFAPAQATPANIAAAYIAKFGAITAGKKVLVQAYEVSSSGGRSNKSQALITIGA